MFTIKTDARQAKVSQLQPSRPVDEKIVWLDVAVNHLYAVQTCACSCNLLEQGDEVRLVHLWSMLQLTEECHVTLFHHHVAASTIPKDFVQLYHIWHLLLSDPAPDCRFTFAIHLDAGVNVVGTVCCFAVASVLNLIFAHINDLYSKRGLRLLLRRTSGKGNSDLCECPGTEFLPKRVVIVKSLLQTLSRLLWCFSANSALCAPHALARAAQLPLCSDALQEKSRVEAASLMTTT
mmetsp:Transcript_14966/g.34100  ORF Transcript_14966/g.34100 Transcript_14966/m.34100 type:complete len:235 (+) Transcript_14966:893-1597(+)